MTQIIFADAAELWRWAERLGWLITIFSFAVALIQARRKKLPRKADANQPPRKYEKRATEFDCRERYNEAMGEIEKLRLRTADDIRRVEDKMDEVEKRSAANLMAFATGINETVRKMPQELVKLLKDAGVIGHNDQTKPKDQHG